MLRALQDSDIDQIRKWLYNPRVREWFERPESWIREISLRETEYSFIRHFIITHEGEDVGFCQYYSFAKGGEDWQGRYPLEGLYSIDYMIGEDEFVGKGIGKKAVLELTRRVFAETDAARIIAQPDAGNLISQKTLLSAGYLYNEKNGVFVAEKPSSTQMGYTFG